MSFVEALTLAVDLFTKAMTGVKQLKDSLPNGPEKEAVAQALQRAQEEFKRAEAQAAQALGYPLCQCTWPPQIMRKVDQSRHSPGYWRCPQCDHVENVQPHSSHPLPQPARIDWDPLTYGRSR